MQGIERIKILASEIKDKALLKIIDYLISREDMNDKYLNEEKSLKQMVDFIKNEAKKENISISSTTTKKTKNIVPEGQLSLFD